MPTVTTEAKKRRRRSQARRARRRERRTHEEREGGLPGWGEIAGRRTSEGGFLARLSTVRFALVVLVLAGACALYVGHVHATQRLLSQVEEARQANRRLHLKLRRLQSTFDEATAPSVVYRRAQKLGLEEGLPEGATIHAGAQHTAP